jgi:hypothetical protein
MLQHGPLMNVATWLFDARAAQTGAVDSKRLLEQVATQEQIARKPVTNRSGPAKVLSH